MLGVWWKRANKTGAIVGIIAGFGICLYYLVATRYYAVSFYEMWSGLSGANDAAVTKYNELKAAFEGAAPEVKAAAWKAFDAHAQKVANWFGVSNISSALFGLPAGFIGMFVGSLADHCSVQGDAGFHRRNPQAQGQGTHGRWQPGEGNPLTSTIYGTGPYGAPFSFCDSVS